MKKIKKPKLYIVEFKENDIIKPKFYLFKYKVSRDSQQLIIIITHNKYILSINNRVLKK